MIIEHRMLAAAVILTSLWTGFPARAEAPPEAPAAAQAAHQVVYPEGLRSRLLRDEPSPVRTRDETIFTGLSPVTASDPAVRLPDDQVMVEPQAGAAR